MDLQELIQLLRELPPRSATVDGQSVSLPSPDDLARLFALERATTPAEPQVIQMELPEDTR